MYMWQKIEIFTLNISKHNKGFILNKNLDKIIHLHHNQCTSLPFKLVYLNNFYDYEILFNNKILTICLLINLSQLKKTIISNTKIPYKNNLFKILHHMNYKNYNNKLYFKIAEMSTIIKNYNIISYNYNDILVYDYILFSLKDETIKLVNKEYQNKMIINILFCFTPIDIIRPYKNNKICIIDHGYNYPLNKNKIALDNYTKINKSFFKNDFIVIDTSFFISKKYTNSYKYYHTDYLGSYSYNNFKTSIKNSDKVYNVELFDNFTIILINIPLNKLVNHPLKYTKSKKIFQYDYINTNLINNITNMLKLHYKNKYNNSILENSFYTDHNKYKIYNMLMNIDSISIKNYNLDSTINYKYFNSYESDVCNINYIPIKYNTHVVFNCGHKFIIEDLHSFSKHYKKCPYCCINISYYRLNLNKNTIVQDLMGIQFKKIYDKYDNHYIMGYNNNSIINLIKKNIHNIYFIDNLLEIENIKNNSVFYFNNMNDKLEILNYISTKINISNISKIVLISCN